MALLLALLAILANFNPVHPYGDFTDRFLEGHAVGTTWEWPAPHAGDDNSYAGLIDGLLVTGP